MARPERSPALSSTDATGTGPDIDNGRFLYAPAPESTAVVDIAEQYGLYVGGRFVDGRGGVFPSVNPATGKTLARVSYASVADVDTAVVAARKAFQNVWGPMRPQDRAKYLYRIGRLLQERAREFAVLETLDNGKPIRETRDVDVPLSAAHFLYHAGWADKLDHVGLGPSPRPHGVVAQVIPWNFPLLMLAWKIAPALAAGNTVVLKPAESTPLSALHFAQICQQAGLPDGVVNIVIGAGDVGAALVAHRGVDKIAFTGSTEVGRRIAATAASNATPVTLELGGKGANIVFDDAALDQAVEGIVDGIFFNQGQVCCAGSRVLVQESVHDELVDRLRERMTRIRVGDPMDKNTDLGAINSAEQLARITELVNAGESEGAQRWSPSCELPGNGFWFPPTLFLGAEQSMRVVREEIFGPVLAVSTFRTPSEAVDKANNTPYGLSAGIWTEKGSRAAAVAASLRAGVVWTNTFNRFDPTSPFGGFKESGWGREGGLAGIGAYLRGEQS
jgi:aldehyde dehydrogenase (NAD+)